ncbi:MAG TPA: hypothetical protein VFC78_02795 [Tepidisphaeraceae bacterium]|nr:hypothetical protein [Tepidisphaeraceae bacterium]
MGRWIGRRGNGDGLVAWNLLHIDATKFVGAQKALEDVAQADVFGHVGLERANVKDESFHVYVSLARAKTTL